MDPGRLALIVAMGVLTYLMRALPQLVLVRRPIPPGLDRYLRYLACALIASVIASTLFFSGPGFDAAAAPRRAAALAVSVALAAASGR
ncbi:MAG TPA: AzlD domain-containing protein, partial [Thermodesulfobacteriota bacterium]|nr:AzlD domain-containing protein [Thermodesulfobacteriota bacterium]